MRILSEDTYRELFSEKEKYRIELELMKEERKRKRDAEWEKIPWYHDPYKCYECGMKSRNEALFSLFKITNGWIFGKEILTSDYVCKKCLAK